MGPMSFAASWLRLSLCAALLAVVAHGVGDAASSLLLAGPDEVRLPTQTSTARSAMPSSWLSRSDEKSSPLLQDSSAARGYGAAVRGGLADAPVLTEALVQRAASELCPRGRAALTQQNS